MQDTLMINNMYAAYSATSSQADKNVSDLSRLMKNRQSGSSESPAAADDKEMYMDKLIISSEALELLKNSVT